MLSYFDDESLSIIDIYGHIVCSNFDLAYNLFKRYISLRFLEKDLTAIKILSHYIYLRKTELDKEQKTALILDNLDKCDQLKLVNLYLECYPNFEMPLTQETS
jgi:hypothetical protein